jgi:hypothetical protein
MPESRAELLARAVQIRDEFRTNANTPMRVGGALYEFATAMQLGATYDASQYGDLTPDDASAASTNRVTIQAAIDAARTAGGGEVVIPGLHYYLDCPYRDENDIYDGYVANDEMRRANKSLIIYDADNVTLVLRPGCVLDRSNDLVADTTYAPYATTLYMSKSRNCHVVGGMWLGAMDDTDLLNDIKSTTSGDHIQINNGCESCSVTGAIFQDGTNGVAVGINRTAAAQNVDPALDPCVNITITNCERRNGEHGILLADCEWIFIDNFRARTFERSDASTGVTQRSLYIYAARNVFVDGAMLTGAFKTGVLISRGGPVSNINFTSLTIKDMMTPAAILAARGSVIDTPWEGCGFSIQTDILSDLKVSGFLVQGCTNGVLFPGFGLTRVTFRDGYIDTVAQGCASVTNFDGSTGMDPLDNQYETINLENVEIRTYEDATDYPSISPTVGLYIASTAVDAVAATINGHKVNTRNVRVYARDRNARILNCDGVTSDCDFTRVTGFAGARNFDFNYSGIRRLANNYYGNNGKPNSVQDVPAAADILGYTELDGPAHFQVFTVAALPSAALHAERVVYCSNGDYGNPCLARSDGANWHVVGSRWGVVSATIPTVTIASGVIAVTTDEVLVDTEGAAASDDLDSITGVPTGKSVIIRPASSSRTVVVKDGSLIKSAGDFSMDNAEDLMVLRWNGSLMREVSRSDSGA